MVKILTILQCANLGGMEKLTLQSLSILKQAGYEVEILSLNDVGDLKTLADPEGIDIHGMRYRGCAGIMNVPQILKGIKRAQPDRIWIVGHNMGALIGSWLSRVPVYHSSHYHHCDKPKFHWAVYYGFARLFVKKFHFGSRFILEEVRSLFAAKDQCLTFINAFPPVQPENKAEVRKRLSLPENALIMGNAGWLIERKAFDVFLRTAALLAKENDQLIFYICGGGELEQELKDLSKELGIEERVYWGGWVAQMKDFYSALDILMFNTRFDCLPNTPMEAMNYGIPTVVSSTYSGIKEVLRHNEDGYYIEEHDEARLRDFVLQLLDHQAEYDRLAKNGPARMQALASPDQHLANLKDFFELS